VLLGYLSETTAKLAVGTDSEMAALVILGVFSRTSAEFEKWLLEVRFSSGDEH
jgi:hypothetical protein